MPSAGSTSTRVCDLIGGCGSTRMPAYASTGFFSDDPDRQLEHMLAEAAAHPYAGTKIKIGRGIKDDVARVKLGARRRWAGQAADRRHQRRLHRRRGAGMRARDRALRHPLDRGAAAAGRPRAAMPSCVRARRSPLGGRRGALYGARLPRADRRALYRHRAALNSGCGRPHRGQAHRRRWRSRRTSGLRRTSGVARWAWRRRATSWPRCRPRRTPTIRRIPRCSNTT